MLLWGVGVLLCGFVAVASDDDEDEGAAVAGALRVLEGGEVAVVLDGEMREALAVRTEAMIATERRDRYAAWAEAVDLAPLLSARRDALLSAATEAVHAAQMETSRAEYRRLQELGDGGRIISSQELRRAQGAFQRDQALVRAEQIRQLTIREQVTQAWNPELAQLVLDDTSAFVDALLSRDLALLRLTLPPGRRLPEAGDPRVVVVLPAQSGRLAQRLIARVMGPAPVTDGRLQGETWWLTVPGALTRTGMRLHAEVESARASEHGVLVPSSAVVWHDGRPWVYVHTEGDALEDEDDAFVRRDLSSALEQADGWFARSGVVPGQEVVVAGATTLLSEEYRWQIPTEDDDDDD